MRGGTTAAGAWVLALVMRRAVVFMDVGTLGTTGRLRGRFAYGAVVVRLFGVGDTRVVVVVSRSCRRWLMSSEGAVMPCRADVQSAMACMSVSAGVMVGL